jgi:alcohol dehydrogenase
MHRVGRAAIYDAPGQPFRIQEYPLRPVHDGEVLVRVAMCTICGSDVHSYHGRRPNPVPGILGHEIVGTVDALGGATRDLRGESVKIGDRITWTEYWTIAPSYERDVLDMPQKSPDVRKYGHERADIDPHLNGGLAEYCYLAPGTGIVRLPADLSDEDATPLNCGAATMVAVTEAAGIGLGEAVVIQGLGLLGLYGVALARSRGARLVIGIDSVAARRAMAQRFGADLTLDAAGTADELVRAVREASGRDGADVAIEVCGIPTVIPLGFRMLRTAGRYVTAGCVNPEAHVTIDANLVVRRWITLRGVHNYHPRHLVQAVDFVAATRARVPFAALVEARFPLTDVDAAFARAADRTAIRAAVLPWA